MAVLWFRDKRSARRDTSLIEFLILLFTDCENVAVATDDARRDLAERGDPALVVFSLENRAAPRKLSINSSARSHAQTPDGKAFLKSSVQSIQEKIDKYQRLGWRDAQWLTASYFGLDFLCGGPWIVVAKLPLYAPPAFFWWWFSFDAYTPRIFYEGAMIAASGGFIAIIGAITMSVWRAWEAKNIVTYPLRQRMRRIARQAALDPGDGLDI